jgi:DNA sulfur modification protein DndD
MEEITNKIFEINREENRRSVILATLEKNKCDICDQNFSEDKVRDLKKDLIELEKSVGLDKNLQSRFQDLSARKNQINNLSDAGSESAIIKSKDDLIRGNLIKIEQWKSEVKRLDDLLKKISLDESPEKIYSKNLGIFESAQSALPILRKQIEIEEASLISVSKKLNDVNPGESPLQSKIDLIDQQITIFNKSIADFREKMRTDIEISASEIFRKLTSEKDYGGLQINDKYYMHIVDTNGRIVERRSQGAEQVVTMSLIGALIDCSVREAPVIMDTPLGRLDTVHGSNILKWIPEMSTQVMLFVTSREFSESIDRPKLGTKIGHEYTLVRESVSRTKIEKTTHGK